MSELGPSAEFSTTASAVAAPSCNGRRVSDVLAVARAGLRQLARNTVRQTDSFDLGHEPTHPPDSISSHDRRASMALQL